MLGGLCFIFLFLFMEETNYHRKPLIENGMEKIEGNGPDDLESDTKNGGVEKQATITEPNVSTISDGEKKPDYSPRKRPIYHRLKLFDKQELLYPNRLKDMVLRPLIFLTFPVIAYAGFSYGSSLVWFNVLNGTTSLILSEEPYGFPSSIVGLAYISPLIGLTLA